MRIRPYLFLRPVNRNLMVRIGFVCKKQGFEHMCIALLAPYVVINMLVSFGGPAIRKNAQGVTGD